LPASATGLVASRPENSAPEKVSKIDVAIGQGSVFQT
jgi:hypothetical protein